MTLLSSEEEDCPLVSSAMVVAGDEEKKRRKDGVTGSSEVRENGWLNKRSAGAPSRSTELS